MKSVTHVITTICRGGAENQLLILCREQVQQGLDVRVVPLKGSPELLNDFLDLGVQVNLSLAGKKFWIQLLRISNKKFQSDIWHAHLPQAELLLTFKKRNGIVITRHFGGKFYPEAPSIISSLLSRIATRGVERVIAISDYVAAYLVTSGEVASKDSIKVVKYGFDKFEFNKVIHRETHAAIKNKGDLKFVSLARLAPEKDLETMIYGFYRFYKELSPNSTLQIFGEGSERRKLTQLINDLGLTQHVFLKGRTDNVPKTLSEFDCFILSSRFEGFGMVLLEAMAAHLPIVCSRIPAAIEVLGERGAGSYFDPGNSDDLANSLKNFKNCDETVRQNEQEKRLEQFSAKKMAEEILNIYLEIAQQPN
jgi:glycosyltransferase involved in cell wall biosynthesis